MQETLFSLRLFLFLADIEDITVNQEGEAEGEPGEEIPERKLCKYQNFEILISC